MQANKTLPQPYADLLTEMDDVIKEADTAGAMQQGYTSVIGVIRKRIVALREMSKASLIGEEETVFFRDVWPAFYSRLFYYLKIGKFLIDKMTLPQEKVAVLIRTEEELVAAYFREHAEFLLYYKTETSLIDPQFTRAYSQACSFDPMCLVIDPDSATLASYRAAWGLAYEDFLSFLQQEKNGGNDRPEPGKGRMEWKESRTAAVELIKAQAEAGSVYIDGMPATATQLKRVFEEWYGEDLKDFDKLLYALDARKKEPAAYLVKLMNAITGRRERLQK